VSATGVITTSNNDVRLILGSLAAGTVGAGLTHLGCALLFAELRDLRRMAVTIAIGALVALLYYAGERDIVDIRWLFVIWQPAVAACIGAPSSPRSWLHELAAWPRSLLRVLFSA